MFETYLACAAIQALWIGVSIWWVIKHNDELPLIASIFLFYVFSFRMWALLQGWTSPVNITNFGFAPITEEHAVEAEALAVFGQSIFLLVYCLVQRETIIVPKVVAPADLVARLRRLAFGLFALCLPITFLTRGAVAGEVAAGKSLAFEVNNYLSLFPLALIGIAILLGALWRAGAFTDATSKVFGALSLVSIAYFTFQPSRRFQFLGWVIAVTIILASGRTVARKAALLNVGLIAAAAMFAVAGALRDIDDPDSDLQQDAWERFAFARDANMLDGFVLLQQVYPDLLDYSHGGEHLEILTRPIPRRWWPGKPVGGYMNKLGIIDEKTGFTLGISPSLFGSFYQEGHLYGLALLSAIYGFVFARLVRYSANTLPLTGLLLRGSLCAALIPLFRGGDLPGIYAWIGMSFWPVLLVFWIYRRELFIVGHGVPLVPAGQLVGDQVAVPR